MNERIQALAIQAGDDWEHTLESDKQFLHKFAELIVRECVAIVNDAERGGDNEVWDNAVKFIRKDIKEHFGVKE